MKASDWIDEIARAEGGCSDYRVAQLLHVAKQTVSNYRKAGKTLDETIARKVEERLGLPEGTVMLDQMAERAADPTVKAVWQRLGKLAARGAAASLVAAMAMGVSTNRAEAFFIPHDSNFENPRVGGSIPSLGTISCSKAIQQRPTPSQNPRKSRALAPTPSNRIYLQL